MKETTIHRARLRRWALVVAATAVATAGCERKLPWPGEPVAAQTAAEAATPSPGLGAPPMRVELPDFTGLVEAYGGAVVNVAVVQQSATLVRGEAGRADEDPLYEFFRRFGIPRPDPDEPRAPLRGMGSGFIVSADGYILTNAHVVSNASEVTVKLTDRREFPAKVIGADARSDVAVLKIDAQKLPVAKLGDADRIKAGQWVVAIGAPFGFENSVTAGIVSGTARSLPDGYVPFIQSDVAVNPGNSGGPLFNLQGEVVGINSQIFSRSGGYMGLSFAIPIDVARNVQEQLIKTGRVERGRIGVMVQELNAQLAESFGLDRPRGALVSAVEPGGPADKAGVKPGDVILKVNEQDIEHSSQLAMQVAMLKPGTTATLSLWRNRGSVPVKVRVSELKEPGTPMRRTANGAEESPRLGLTVWPLTAEEREALSTEGTLVVAEAAGRAAAAGIEVGDVILAVNGKPVRSAAELRKAVEQAGKVIALLIQREEAQIFVPIPIEDTQR